MAIFFLLCTTILLSSLSGKAVRLLEPYPSDPFPIAGSELSSTCVFEGDNGNPPERVKFQRKSGPFWSDIPDSDRVYQTNKTSGDKVTVTLNFKNVTVQDDLQFGRYSCVGFPQGVGLYRIGFAIRVTPREDLPVARVIPNMTVSYGDTARLYCNLTHKNNETTTPIEKVTFLKNGRPVRQTNDIMQPYILADIESRDGGNYGCLITVFLRTFQPYNITPTSTAYLHVRIRFPFKESKVVADVGDSVGLVCSAQGFPLNVIWQKNQAGSSAVIKPGGRFILKELCRYCQSVLVIQNVTAADSGDYSCSAFGHPGQHIFLVKVRSNSTVLIGVATATTTTRYVTAIFPAFFWIWWPF